SSCESSCVRCSVTKVTRFNCLKGVYVSKNAESAARGWSRLPPWHARAYPRPQMAKGPDPFEIWRRRRHRQGPSVTLIDLYRMVAEPRGLAAHELPLAERAALSLRALPLMWPGYQVPAGTERA